MQKCSGGVLRWDDLRVQARAGLDSHQLGQAERARSERTRWRASTSIAGCSRLSTPRLSGRPTSCFTTTRACRRSPKTRSSSSCGTGRRCGATRHVVAPADGHNVVAKTDCMLNTRNAWVDNPAMDPAGTACFAGARVAWDLRW